MSILQCKNSAIKGGFGDPSPRKLNKGPSGYIEDGSVSIHTLEKNMFICTM